MHLNACVNLMFLSDDLGNFDSKSVPDDHLSGARDNMVSENALLGISWNARLDRQELDIFCADKIEYMHCIKLPAFSHARFLVKFSLPIKHAPIIRVICVKPKYFFIVDSYD